jgi:hypothetical protein
MKIVVLLAIFFSASVALPADLFRLEGESFQPPPKVEIVWSVPTSNLPFGLWVYKVVPQTFPAAVFSNLMAIGNFTKADLTKPPHTPVSDKNLIRFQTKSGHGFTRYLNIAPTFGWIEYYSQQDANEPVADLPSKEETERLALDCLFQLGIDRSLVCHKRTGYDATRGKLSREGRKLTEELFERGISFARQIDGVETRGFRFLIHFRNQGKIKDFSLSWRNLSPYEAYRVATPNQIIKMLKTGKAIIPSQANSPASLTGIEKLKIVNITTFYFDNTGSEALEFSFPYAELEMLVESGGTNKNTFYLQCPVLGESIR